MQRFLLACALSFIGSVVALELGAYWWVGLALGFVAGYIGYDLSEAVTAVPRAWKAARAYIDEPPVSKDRLRLFFHWFGACASATATILIFTFAIDYFMGFTPRPPYTPAIVLALAVSGLTSIGAPIEKCREYIMAVHPIPLFFWWIPRGIVWVVARISSVVAIIGRFCKTFIAHAFRYIHSNARLLFGIDVAIGVAVGYFTGSALLGGLAGGAWWLLDWHLVSIKLMGVKPA